MIEAAQVLSVEKAWYDHWMAVAGQWSVLLGLAMGVIQFYRAWQKEKADRQKEKIEIEVWRGRMDERVKCLERRD